MRSIIIALLTLAAFDVHAFSFHVLFPDKNDRTILLIRYRDGTKLLQPENECDGNCANRYFLQRKKKDAAALPPIEKVVVRPGVFGTNDTMAVKLATAVDDVGDLFLVATDVVVDADGQPKSSGWKEFSIAPQIEQAADELTTFEYVSLTPTRFENDPPTRAKFTQSLVVADADDSTLRYSPLVSSVTTGGTGERHLHKVELSGVPRGKKVKVSLKGVEQFAGKDVGLGPTVIAPVAFPKGREDALLFIRGSAEANDVKGEKAYSFDFRLHPKWTLGSFEIAPNVEATVGNKLSKAPNSGSVGLELRKWMEIADESAFFPAQAFAIAPTFWTDREFDNRDAGAILTWEPYLRWFEGNTLEQRRARTKADGGLPRAIKWGFRLRPVLGFEGGTHIASTSPEVDDEDFARLLGKMTGFVQYQQWTFTVTAERRHLFSDEVLSTTDGVVAIDDGVRSNVKLELGYDFGPAAISVTRINGRVPPAFSATKSTTLGVTFKY